MSTNRRDTFCVLPWINLEIRPNGKIAPCCISRFSLPDAPTLKQAFESETLADLRKNLGAGKRDPNCERCWSNEDGGNRSRRKRFNQLYKVEAEKIKHKKFIPSQPLILDLKPSNICNLKCRICGPTSSSLWMSEFGELYGQAALEEQVSSRVFPDSEIENWLPNIRRLELSGGEPFLNKKYITWMERSIALGYAKNQELQIVTNGTIFPEEWLEKYLPHFGNVDILISIDGIKSQFEYQRYPAKWVKVLNNYRCLKKTPFLKHVVLTVSLLNVYYIPQYFLFWQSLGERVAVNVLLTPQHLSIRALHEDLRSKLCEYLYRFEGLDTGYRAELDTIIKIIAGENQSQFWPEFVSAIKTHDAYRNQKFEEIFPEFFEFCSGYW